MSLPPGPQIPLPVATYKMIKRPYDLLGNAYKQFGEIFTIRIMRLGKVVFVGDPDIVRDIFTKHAKKFNAGETADILEPFLGQYSLLLLDGPEHARQRKLLAPAFHGERMRMFGDLMRDLAHKMMDQWKPGQQVLLRQEMQSVTLRVIVESVFGKALSERAPELIEIVRHLVQLPTFLTFLPFLRVNLGGWGPWGRFLKWREKMDTLLFADIARRRANPHAEPEDVVDMLLLSRDEEGNLMTDKEIRDEAITLLLAGHETTALSLTWFFVSILQHPEALAKILAEYQEVVGDEPLHLDHLPKLVYLEAAIKESMRMNNLFPIVGRKTLETVELKGYEIPPGVMVAPCNLVLHQLPSLYPEPEVFRPERFLGEPIHPYGWLPFGGGPRRCIGMSFAIFEMKILLACILPRVQMSLVPGQDFTPERMTLALAPPTGVNVNILAVKPNPVLEEALVG